MSRLSYFEYANSRMSPSLIAAINETIEENKAYATVIWKSRADDAIDATLHNALKYYSPEKGELRNYIISTMKTVLKNSLKKEHSVENDTLTFLVDASREDTVDNSLDDLLTEFDDEVSECVVEFLPYVVDDYEFFSTLKKTKMKNDYSSILGKYSSRTVVSALQAITTMYLPKVAEFMSFPPLPYVGGSKLGSLGDICDKYGSPVKVLGVVQGTALVRGYSTKDMISIDLSSLALAVFDSIYSSSEGLVLEFGGRVYYRTPTWGVVSSRSEVLEAISRYCLGYLCKQLGFLVSGIEGETIYLLGNAESLVVELFGFSCSLSYRRVTRKEVVC